MAGAVDVCVVVGWVGGWVEGLDLKQQRGGEGDGCLHREEGRGGGGGGQAFWGSRALRRVVLPAGTQQDRGTTRKAGTPTRLQAFRVTA